MKHNLDVTVLFNKIFYPVYDVVLVQITHALPFAFAVSVCPQVRKKDVVSVLIILAGNVVHVVAATVISVDCDCPIV